MGEAALDVDYLRGWIGREETARDTVTPRLIRELSATLNGDDGDAAAGAPAPLAVHWCLAPPAARAGLIGPDGHPARGGFLPPVPLPRRMWAGGTLTLHDRLRCGDAVTRHSRIVDVTVKEGRSGVLCFVTVAHEISTPRGPALSERQDIVYRPMQPYVPATPRPDAAPANPQWHKAMRADPVLLFRYSALTFNGHRIHYDRPYATEVELYPGLVVHGPLQATMLLDHAAGLHGSAPARFSFRGVAPLFDFMPFRLCARAAEAGLDLWVETEAGVRTMEATARWW